MPFDMESRRLRTRIKSDEIGERVNEGGVLRGRSAFNPRAAFQLSKRLAATLSLKETPPMTGGGPRAWPAESQEVNNRAAVSPKNTC